MKDSMKDVVCYFLSEYCGELGNEGLTCAFENHQIEYDFNKIPGKCPFMKTYNKETDSYSEPEIIIDGDEVEHCMEVTPEHWKAWIDKYENII